MYTVLYLEETVQYTVQDLEETWPGGSCVEVLEGLGQAVAAPISALTHLQGRTVQNRARLF